MKFIVYVLLADLWLAGCSAPEKKTATPPGSTQKAPSLVESGKILFEAKCSSCHGPDGTAGIANAADLTTSRMDSLSIIKTITLGKNSMPAFKEQLGTGEIEQITAYVRSLRK